MTSEKIRPHHLERKAILYVRQSSVHQVLHNRESSALQYAMRDRLTALGWSRIETVDDDLGRSAAGGVARAGFDRMVAEVCLGKVGAVCAREVSRFACPCSKMYSACEAGDLRWRAVILCQLNEDSGSAAT
jgi:DNA invertase Pin-like site-specific DNA recombinase